jgi:hypothetical protein
MTTFSFNNLLSANGINPDDVLLVRHNAKDTGLTYDTWRTNRASLEAYQSKQLKPFLSTEHQAIKHWAVFMSTRNGGTVFIGMYNKTGPIVPRPTKGN